MRYFKDKLGEIYAFEDDVSEEIINQKIKDFGLKQIREPQIEQPKQSEEEILQIKKQEFLNSVDEILNQTAIAKGYDSIVSAVSYAGYENSFQAEGIKFGKWRSRVYEWGYGLLEEIKKGKRSLPQSFEDIKNEMPKFE